MSTETDPPTPSDENVTVSPSFTVGVPLAYLKYEKKAGEYNNEGVNLSIPIQIPEAGVSSQEFLKLVGETLEHAKALAWDALRIEYSFDADKGVLIPAPTAPPVQAAPIGGGTPPPRPPAPPITGGGDGEVNPQPPQTCGLCGSDSFNNTLAPKRNPRSPDYKCKNRDCGAAMWLTGKSGGTWKQ